MRNNLKYFEQFWKTKSENNALKKKKDLSPELSELKSRLKAIEAEVKSKDEEIEDLREQVEIVQNEKEWLKNFTRNFYYEILLRNLNQKMTRYSASDQVERSENQSSSKIGPDFPGSKVGSIRGLE